MATATRATAIVPEAGVSVGLTVEEAKTSFARSLRAANKAPRTVQTYLDALEVFDRFLAGRGIPFSDKPSERVAHEGPVVAAAPPQPTAVGRRGGYRGPPLQHLPHHVSLL